MSQETNFWLNNMTLQGMTAKRGKAWHYMASAQGQEPNHYDGAIPVEDVQRRLFGRLVLAEGNVSTVFTTTESDGVETRNVITAPDRKTIVRPAGTFGETDKGEILGIFKDGYQVHDYQEWLVDNVGNLLDNGLSVASAGLLKGGAVAWVQAEVDGDSITTPEGFTFRPFITAATSVDGSLATTYLRGVQAVVCDNTLSAALGEGGAGKVKYRHSRYSLLKIADARAALDIVFETGEDFAAQVKSLCEIKVTDAQFDAFLESLAPTKNADGTVKAKQSLTMAQNKHDALLGLWRNDNRVSPWAGSAFGVLQAVNTYTHHIGTVKNTTRQERNMLNMVTGKWDGLDSDTMTALNKVLASA